jgi:hypothetical protein
MLVEQSKQGSVACFWRFSRPGFGLVDLGKTFVVGQEYVLRLGGGYSQNAEAARLERARGVVREVCSSPLHAASNSTRGFVKEATELQNGRMYLLSKIQERYDAIF